MSTAAQPLRFSRSRSVSLEVASIVSWADHRTPIKGLYLCGAASHPGGGVMGACGKNAAEEILREF